MTRCFKRWRNRFEIAEREMLARLQCEDFKEGVAHFVERKPALIHWKIDFAPNGVRNLSICYAFKEACWRVPASTHMVTTP